ncbi:MAG: GPP34 family phosphoprotein [Blastococcus sp.]
MDLPGGVAVRVSTLCLDSRGRLADRLLCGTAVRAGLLLDLALGGRLESEDDSIVVDGTPTGFSPADRLLAAIAVEPERSLDEWLDETRLGLRDVAEANVVSGRWRLRRGPLGFGRRYLDRSPERTALDLRRPVETTQWSPEDACVAAIACASGLGERDTALAEAPPAAVIAAAGRVSWLCTAVVEHLLLTGQRYRSEAGALGAGPVGPF